MDSQFELIRNEIKNINEQISKEIHAIKIDNVEIKTNQQNMSNAIIKLAETVREIAIVQADIKIITQKLENHDENITKLFDLYSKTQEGGLSVCKVREIVVKNLQDRVDSICSNIAEKEKEEEKRNFQIKMMLASTILGWLFALVSMFIKN